MEYDESKVIFAHCAVRMWDDVVFVFHHKSIPEMKEHIMKRGYTEREFEEDCEFGFYGDVGKNEE